MSLLRNKKIINKNSVQRKRVKDPNARTSKDIDLFLPVDRLIYCNLPTKSSVLNYYFNDQKQNHQKKELIKTIATEVHNVWVNFVEINNFTIKIVTPRQIETAIDNLITSWQKIQKHISRPNCNVSEGAFCQDAKLILNCAKKDDKSFFMCEDEDLNLHNLPRGEFNTFYFMLR